MKGRMMRVTSAPVTAALCLVVALLAQSAQACGKKWLARSAKQETVELTSDPDTPAYYWRTESGYVVFFNPADVIAKLQQSVKAAEQEGANSARIRRSSLLEAVNNDQPLSAHTDLFKYALVPTDFASELEYLTAEILATGRVSIDPWMGFHHVAAPGLKSIRMVTEMSSTIGPLQRWFCTPDDREILYISYVMFD
jgi:hypothetical protein